MLAKVISFKALQPENASALIRLTFAGILIALSEVQSLNAAVPIDFNADGNLISSRLIQPSNADEPISLTLFPIITVLNSVQPIATEALTEVTPLPSLKLLKFVL